jgi:hypothetical protein
MNETPTKLVHDVATGQIKEVELTVAEIAQRQQDQTQSEADEGVVIARQQAIQNARDKSLAQRFVDEDVTTSKEWKEIARKLNARIEYLESLVGL